MNRFRKSIYTIIFVTFLIVLSIVGSELLCRVAYSIVNKLVDSKVILDYEDIFRTTGIGIGGYLKANFDNFVIGGYQKPVKFKTNSMGFRYYKDVSFSPGSGVVRILSLGDSFAAGYRIEQEQTYSRLLEKYFNTKKKSNKYEVLISCIDEPKIGLFYLSTYGIKFKPAVVILGVTLGNDILQNYGVDIAGENKTIPPDVLDRKTKCGLPKNNSLINKSMLYKNLTSLFQRNSGEAIISFCRDNGPPKLYDLCNGFGFYIKNAPEEISDAYNKLFETIDGYKRLAIQYNFKLILVIFPQRFQVQKEDWIATCAYYNLNADCFDLMKPNDLILNFCRKEGINCIDPTLDMAAFYNKKRKSLYFLLGDMHFNALGNKVLYETIKERVYRLINENP